MSRPLHGGLTLAAFCILTRLFVFRDQATVYRQIGLLPDRVPFITLDGRGGTVRLPTTSTGHGQEEAPARKLADPLEGSSNEMMGDEWGFKEAIAAENPKI